MENYILAAQQLFADRNDVDGERLADMAWRKLYYTGSVPADMIREIVERI